MRKIIIAGNWKMNKALNEVESFCQSLLNYAAGHSCESVRMILAPAFPFLKTSCQLLEAQPVSVSAQDVSAFAEGAYTGEVSAAMLASLGLQYCIIGHSERRQYHNENDALIREKQMILRSHGILPILCIGESLEERDQGIMETILLSQLSGSFKNVALETGLEVIVAYEPVWAIGTGRTASPQQAEEAHALIRNWFRRNYSDAIAEQIHILYGGSVKPDNIAELLAEPDIDGGLIGGASLKVDSFVQMTMTAVEIYKTRI